MELQGSSTFKLRALLHQLRPRFLEVLKEPDFRKSKAAQEIRKDMELLIELHKKMVLKTSQSAIKEAGLRLTHGSKKRSKKKRHGDGMLEGSYIVGGSVLGWNFVTVLGSKPVYYGITKKSFRSSQRKVAIH